MSVAQSARGAAALGPGAVRSGPRPRTGWVSRSLIAAWGLGMALISAGLLAKHLVALPAPAAGDPALAGVVAQTRGMRGIGDWLGVHVLYGECPCSRKIAEVLLDPARPRPEGLTETMVLVGADPELEARAAAAGFAVEVVAADQLEARWKVQAAPLLVLADPTDRLRYVGGYTARKQGPDVQDIELLARLQADAPVEPLPLFGCAVSQALRAAADPVGLF